MKYTIKKYNLDTLRYRIECTQRLLMSLNAEYRTLDLTSYRAQIVWRNVLKYHVVLDKLKAELKKVENKDSIEGLKDAIAELKKAIGSAPVHGKQWKELKEQLRLYQQKLNKRNERAKKQQDGQPF